MHVEWRETPEGRKFLEVLDALEPIGDPEVELDHVQYWAGDIRIMLDGFFTAGELRRLAAAVEASHAVKTNL